MLTPFEQGKRDGTWSREQIDGLGTGTLDERLEQQEQYYQEEVVALARIHNPEYAARQQEYLEGFITAIRESFKREMEI